MQQKILERAEKYAAEYDFASLENDDIRAKSPILFVILGNEVKESICFIKQTMHKKFINAEGAVYFYIGTSGLIEEERVVSLSLPFDERDEKTKRNALSKKFIEDQQLLIQFNEKVTKIKNMILEQNKLFSNWQQIYVSVISAAGDETSVLIPDITVFLKKKFLEVFKQVAIDLFVIAGEEDETQEALRQAMTMSLFKELDFYQDKNYRYSGPIEMLPGDIRVDVEHTGELFDLIYLLTDRKENGEKIKNAKRNHYETLCYVSLLKNRYQKNIETSESKEQYNNTLFRNNIRKAGEHRYASCNLAKVKRPGIGIYMTVAYHLYREYIKTITYENKEDIEDLCSLIGLSEEKLNSFALSFLSAKDVIKNIHTLMCNEVSFKALKNLSFRDAETMLYQESCKDFFELNFLAEADKKLKDEAYKIKIEKEILDLVINHKKYGPYAIGELFKEYNAVKIRNLREQIMLKKVQKEALLEEKENSLVGQKIGTHFSLFDKKYLRDVKAYLIDEIYELKYSILHEDVKLKQIDCIHALLEKLHEKVKKDINKLENIEQQLNTFREEAARFEEDYLVQNVNEYYQKIVTLKVEKLRKNRGEQFFCEEAFMGNTLEVLKKDPENLMERLFEIEEKYILNDEALFNLPFEEELLERANISAQYEDEKIVAKTDLYKMLYESLEENSRACVYLDTTQSDHHYEEKYFFADRESEFIRYAYERDKASRNYKLGCINDKKKSSIEKIQLIGGFRLSDLILSKSAARYYEVYTKAGYKFHRDEDLV